MVRTRDVIRRRAPTNALQLQTAITLSYGVQMTNRKVHSKAESQHYNVTLTLRRRRLSSFADIRGYGYHVGRRRSVVAQPKVHNL